MKPANTAKHSPLIRDWLRAMREAGWTMDGFTEVKR
jgi:hypothetical protein